MNNYKFSQYLCMNRQLCVFYETLRWLWHKIFFFVREHTPVWYQFDKKHVRGQAVMETLPIHKEWYHIKRPLYRHEHVYYDFDKALAVNPSVQGLALIFFMGIGDYLYTTPMIEALKKKYPQLSLHAHVGAQFDRNNSPLVGKLLENNPHIDKVFYFEGVRHPLIWKNYNYQNALKNIPENFLVVPVYYDYSVNVSHRVHSLFETFGLEVPAEVPVPKMYFPKQPAAAVGEYLIDISQKAEGKKGIVFLQLDSRSSNYTYPHVRALAQGLIDEGYFVLSVTKGGPYENSNYIELDIKRLSINDTWQLLYMLKQKFSVSIISVVSVFWAASAGLGLRNLGMHHWIDPKMHNVWYPNIEVVTHHVYPKLPLEKQILAPAESYTAHNRKMVDFQAQWIIKWFKEKFEK